MAVGAPASGGTAPGGVGVEPPISIQIGGEERAMWEGGEWGNGDRVARVRSMGGMCRPRWAGLDGRWPSWAGGLLGQSQVGGGVLLFFLLVCFSILFLFFFSVLLNFDVYEKPKLHLKYF